MNLSESIAAVEEVRYAMTQAREDEKTARDRLKHLERQLPALLAGRVLGQITTGEVEAARAEVREVRGFLDEVPLLLEGLTAVEAERVKAMEAARKTEQRGRDEERYAEYRKRFEDSCRAGVIDRHGEQEFRQISHQTGRIDTDRRFIHEMIRTRERTAPAAV